MAPSIMIIYWIICNVTMGYALDVIPMDNGILVKRNLAVRQKLMEWRITFTLDNPNPEMEYKLITSIHNLKQSLIALTDPKDQERLPIQHWLNLLNEMEGETEIPNASQETTSTPSNYR